MSTGIALNVTRTRVTLLTFNLTIISVMLSMLGGRGTVANQAVLAHLTSSVALFTGFYLTLLGLYWLLSSQDWDEQGLSHLLGFVPQPNLPPVLGQASGAWIRFRQASMRCACACS